MSGSRHRRFLGPLALLFYLGGGAGSPAVMLADLLRHDGPHQAVGACGCTEGASCCGAACCAPPAAVETAAGAAMPSCCAPEPVAADPASPCCGEGAAPAPTAAAVLAMVARCTCGHRGRHAAFVRAHDAHLPVFASGDPCPPPYSPTFTAWRPQAASWRPEPRDRVPKHPGSVV